MNPVDIINNLGGKIASTGLSKLQEHFHLTSKNLDKLREAVDTPMNRAMVVGTASTVTFLAIHSMTRPALFAFLGMGYSITVITFNLMILGLSAALLLYKAGKMVVKSGASLSGFVVQNASEITKEFKKEKKSTAEAAAPAEASRGGSSAAAPAPVSEIRHQSSADSRASVMDGIPGGEGVIERLVVSPPAAAEVVNPMPTEKELADALGTPHELDDAWDDMEGGENNPTSATDPVVTGATGKSDPIPASKTKEHDDDSEVTYSVADIQKLSPKGGLPISRGSVTDSTQQTGLLQRAKQLAGKAVNAVGGPKKIAKGAAVAVGIGVAIFAAYKVHQKLKEIRDTGVLFEFDPEAEPVEDDSDDNYDLYM